MTDLITKIRTPKIAGIAVFDLAGSIGIAIMIANTFNTSKLKTISAVLLLGEVVHIALAVNTPITRKLYDNNIHEHNVI